jgi:hypothetical protein
MKPKVVIPEPKVVIPEHPRKVPVVLLFDGRFDGEIESAAVSALAGCISAFGRSTFSLTHFVSQYSFDGEVRSLEEDIKQAMPNSCPESGPAKLHPLDPSLRSELGMSPDPESTRMWERWEAIRPRGINSGVLFTDLRQRGPAGRLVVVTSNSIHHPHEFTRSWELDCILREVRPRFGTGGVASRWSPVGGYAAVSLSQASPLAHRELLNYVYTICRHEFAHLMGLEHCDSSRCVMNAAYERYEPPRFVTNRWGVVVGSRPINPFGPDSVL